MTVVLIDACNEMTGVLGGGTAPGSPKWDANFASGDAPFISDDGRGARCIRIDGFSTNFFQQGMYKTYSAADEVMCSAYMRFSRADTRQPLWNFYSDLTGGGGSPHVRLISDANVLHLYGPVTSTDLRAVGSYVWQDNLWVHVEVYLKIRNDATGRFIVKLKPVGGAAVTDIDFTGNTYGSGPVTSQGLNWLGDAGNLEGTHDLADVIIRTGESTFYGVTRVRTLRPNGTGDLTQLTPTPAVANYLTQADIPNDGDTTYVQGVAAAKDLYSFSNVRVDDVPLMAQLVVQAKDVSGTASIAALAKTSSQVQGATQPTTPTYKTYVERYITDPADASAWTKAKIDAAQFGVTAVT